MKTFKQHILEKLKISSKRTTHTLFPETLEELFGMITDEIYKHGYECSLNHIDVSKITNMSQLFLESKFNGDISEWDVSNVENMGFMFYNSKFNGDISDWNVSKVEHMMGMFGSSKFTGENGDISNWDVSKVTNMRNMFFNSPLENNPPKWYEAV